MRWLSKMFRKSKATMDPPVISLLKPIGEGSPEDIIATLELEYSDTLSDIEYIKKRLTEAQRECACLQDKERNLDKSLSILREAVAPSIMADPQK